MTANDENVTSNDELKAEIIKKSMEETPKGLKIVVLVLGILIIAMVVLMVGMIVYRASNTVIESKPVEIAKTVNKTIAKPQLMTPMKIRPIINVMRPDGAILVTSQVNGIRLLLQFKLADGGDVIKIVDLNNGSVISEVAIAP